MSEEKKYTKAETHQAMAAGLNGVVWELLALGPERTPEQDDRMIHAAHASCYHWLEVGTELHQQRAHWLLTHVYSELGHGEAALRHAKRCGELTEKHADLMEDFDIAYAHEGLARGHAAPHDAPRLPVNHGTSHRRSTTWRDSAGAHSEWAAAVSGRLCPRSSRWGELPGPAGSDANRP